MTAPSTAWPKGQSGNPSGRPRLPDTTARLKEQGKIAAIEALAKVLAMTQAELSRLPKDPSTPAALLLAASVMHKAIKTGCPVRANFIYQYLVGKPETNLPEPPDPQQNRREIRLAYSSEDLEGDD